MPTSVMPVDAALRTAKAVGADTPTMIAAPIMPAFCTSSMDPARQHNDPLGSRPAGAQQRSRQFVERIVPSHVFAQNKALIRPPERRGVDCSRLHVQLLSRR